MFSASIQHNVSASSVSSLLCIYCVKELPLDCFTKTQKKMKNRPTAKCRECHTPPQGDRKQGDIMCVSCGIRKGLDSFSKKQKKNRSTAKCRVCTGIDHTTDEKTCSACGDTFKKEGFRKSEYKRVDGECRECRAGIAMHEQRGVGVEVTMGKKRKQDGEEEEKEQGLCNRMTIMEKYNRKI